MEDGEEHMQKIKCLCVFLLLLGVIMLPSGLVRAQDSEIITVTGLYSSEPHGEYQSVLVRCDSFEVWDLADNPAFAKLSQAYAAAKADLLFVEAKGRYTAYEEESHKDGRFEITELVRHSTDATELKTCGYECEDVFGTSASVCIDGQCGSGRNSCVTGRPFDHEEGSAADTATHYRWLCLGSYGGDSAYCTAPKTGLQGAVEGLAHLHSGPLTLYGWAYYTASPTTSIPIEIYVGGARGTGTLAATITADQSRPDINTAQGLTGAHGFAWAVPTQYQSSAQSFYLYALDQTPTPTLRTQLSPDAAPLTLRAVGTAGYCQHHGPCPVDQGDCTSNAECQSGLKCVANAGARHGFGATIGVCEDGGSWTFCSATRPCPAGLGDCDSNRECESGLTCMHNVGAQYGYPSTMDVCAAKAGEEAYCLTTQPCKVGEGDCDHDAECQSGLTCVEDVGATYTFAADVDVCVAATSVTPTPTTQTQTIYRRATTTPSTPSGGTSTENHIPSDWSTTQPTPTTTQGVYQSQRTVTYQGGVFQSATAWGTPTLVVQVQSIYRLATSAPSTPSGGTSTENHVPSGWRTTQPTPTTTQGVYRSQRTVTYQGGVFQSATAWGTPTQIATPTGSTPVLRGYVDVISRLHGSLTLYGWAYNTAASTTSIPVEIYVGGARGTGTLVATLTANQSRPDVNQAYQITGNHGFEWPIPTTYQTGTHQFSVYALDQSPTPTVRTHLNPTSITLLAPGHADYCKNHGPCIAGHGDCDPATPSQCQSGLICATDVGANYGWSAITDVCEAPQPVVTTRTETIYRRATTTPARPTSSASSRPAGWSTTKPSATTTQAVYRSTRTVTLHDGTPHSATVWSVPVEVTAKLPPPTLQPGHADYCKNHGPCRAGQGDCDTNSECQSGLRCAHDVGSHYGWSAITDVCEASRTMQGFLDLVGVHNGRPVTVYGWAVDPLRTSISIPVEIYVGGPRGTGTLVATVTANRPRADVNQALGIRGNHGFEWAVPSRYRTGRQKFYAYALDTTPNPNWRTHLGNSPLTGP